VDEKCFVGKVRQDAKSLVARLHAPLFSEQHALPAFIVSEQKAKCQNLLRGGRCYQRLIIRKIVEFAKPVDLVQNSVYDPHAT
jgi:hypothetical protein